MRFSLEHLEVFVAVVEAGSFSEAARRLGNAQSRVSTIIANFETDLGVELFDRSGKYPKLTQAGDQLLPRILEMVRHGRELTDEAARIMGEEQTLVRVAVDELLPPMVMVEVLEGLSARYPAMEVDVFWGAMGDVAGLVEAGRVDVGVEMPCRSEPPAGCAWQVLAQTDFCGVAAPHHPLARLTSITRNDVWRHRQILAVSREGNRLPQEFRLGKRIWQCEDSRLIREIIRKGLAWGACARYQVAGDLKRGTMVELPMTLGECGFTNTFFFVWQKEKVLSEAEAWIMGRVSEILKNLCAAK